MPSAISPQNPTLAQFSPPPVSTYKAPFRQTSGRAYVLMSRKPLFLISSGFLPVRHNNLS